ncbi:MAG: ModE family transcriptional regulator [Pseudomonadota bacterium]
MGPGKADLLEAIRDNGSISAAGRRLRMSYRRAWLLVNAMNRCWAGPLVATSPGAAPGSGARLTPLGATVLLHYRAIQSTASSAGANADWCSLSALLRVEPLELQDHG